VDDRGASIVEASIVTTLLFLLIFGVIEGGLTFGDYLGLANSTRAGARVASASGSDGLTDYYVLQSIAAGSTAIPRSAIDRIVVFKAATPDAPVPSACTTGTTGVSGECNVYAASDFDLASTRFGCSTASPPSPDRFWCPTSRKTARTGANGPPDIVGVWMKIRHPMLTGFFGTQLTFSDGTLMRIEPRRAE
jgi:hypothetical protein